MIRQVFIIFTSYDFLRHVYAANIQKLIPIIAKELAGILLDNIIFKVIKYRCTYVAIVNAKDRRE